MTVATIKPEIREKLRAIGVEIAVAPGVPENIAAIASKVTSRGGSILALLEIDASQARALCEGDGHDPDLDAHGCPGDPGYVAPAPGGEARRTLACLVRERLIAAWYAPPVLPGEKALVSVMLTPEQGLDWLNHLDKTTTALVDEKPSRRKPEHKSASGGRKHVFAGFDPDDDGDDREQRA
jgi:hypothetical protein